MRAVFKREVQAYFKSPVAYCIISFFLMLTGLNFWNLNLYRGSIEFPTTLASMTTFLTFFAPIITMKLLSEEKKNGTEVLLKTSPVSMWKIVLGKYFASLTVFCVIVVLTMICPILMSFYVNDGGVFPLGMTVGGYVGFFLLGAAYLAVGTFASSVTESQPVAAVLGVVILLGISFIENIGQQIGGVFGQVLIWISLSSRYSDFASGLFSLPSLFYYLSLTAVILFVTVMNIERKRWN